MKRILITGANSYIGTSFEKWVSQWPDNYQIDTLDTKGDWKSKSFRGYDVIFSVVGIAHVNAKKKMKPLYYQINRDLTIALAKKAKQEKVKQFIFMSSLIVYGNSTPIGVKEYITKETVPKPANFYGDSKLQAENGIRPLQSEDFNVVILRPPMIYGPGCKGNLPKLAKFAKYSPIFPDIENERSMLYIDNLCEFVRLMVDNEEKGIFFPQNEETVCTTEIVKALAKQYGKRIYKTKCLNPILRLMSQKSDYINKIFGNLACKLDLSNYKDCAYCVTSFNDTLKGW